MVEFRMDKETPDYITMDRNGLLYLGMEGKKLPNKLPNNVYQEVSDMINTFCSFEYSTKEELEQIGSSYLTSFKIRKESALGQYLIENNGKNEIINESEYISYKNICDAMLITIVNDDAKMANKITPLVQKQCCGTKEEILKEFPYHEDALNFIMDNNDFDAYLANKNQGENPIQETKPFVVYEEGEWAIKNLEEDYIRVPKKA